MANDWKPNPYLADVTLEIEVNNRKVTTNEWIFRSWTGRRWVNGTLYTGGVFNLGSNEPARTRRATLPCPCECNSGQFCGGCGHAGCGRR